MAAIVAFEDFQRFGVLPKAGGTFDQPDQLMGELRLVADRVADAQQQKAKQELDRFRNRRMGRR